MIIGQVLAPVHSLGPGERICIWVQGCNKGCLNCMSPELQNNRGQDVSSQDLYKIIRKVAEKTNCNRLTLSGGDPFEQSASLLEFIMLVRPCFEDILVYTGYDLQEIIDGVEGEAGVECLKYIDVLIDGRYIRELNAHECVLRGSSNQVIHFLNPEIQREYLEYMKKGRIVENFIHGNRTIVTGILDEV